MPIGAVIGAAVIGAGGALGSGAISSKAQKDAQKKAETSPLALAQKAAIDQQSAYGKTAGDAGTSLLPKYTAGVDYLSNYWKSVMSDNNSEAMKAIAPLVQARKSMTSGTLRSLDFAPRGGGYGEAVSGVYDSQNRDILNLLAGERTNARSGFASLTGDVGARATNLLGTGAGAAGSSASLLGSMADRSLQAGQIAGQQSSATTAGLADALSPLIYHMIFKPGSSTGPASPKPPVIPTSVLMPPK
jgi:hypothetical protein